MLRGIAFIILALLVLVLAIVSVVTARDRDMAQLDRRLLRRTPGATTLPHRQKLVFIPDRVAPLFAQAQIELDRKTVVWSAGAIGLIALVMIITQGPVAGLVVLLVPPLAGYIYVSERARRRVAQLIEALPHYIDAVRQMQMVGSSLPQALERALQEAPPIVRSYMAPVARRLELGTPVSDAMQLLAERLRVAEVAMLATAIRTNLRFGGSITTVLANLANVLRARLRIRRELEAATSQAKVSGRILIAMPLVAIALLVTMSPAYLDFFIGDARGHRLALIALVLQIGGIVVMRRMMRLTF
ncbi:MAG TPA: type II secretion system F family protein [Sphingobium sp.]|nr:type II secretion system F family protein [Sphingobium sp.]